MEIEKILTLIDKVSASGLTEFTLEEGNLQLCMKKEKVVKICTEDTAAEQGEVFMEAGKNSVASRNPANHDPEESFTGISKMRKISSAHRWSARSIWHRLRKKIHL